jgi:hypothetical protein
MAQETAYQRYRNWKLGLLGLILRRHMRAALATQVADAS